MATLYLTVGLPYTGKTTYAKILARERHAVRLTPDCSPMHPELP